MITSENHDLLEYGPPTNSSMTELDKDEQFYRDTESIDLDRGAHVCVALAEIVA
jgi:hypothetical protein